jgi:DNA-binding response OmpR family regulator
MQETPDKALHAKSLLLLEKEERPMRIVRACLERMGYRVLTSSSAEWTREMLEDPGIDLLIASISRDEEGEHLALLQSVLGNRPVLFVEAEDRSDTHDTATHDNGAEGLSSGIHYLDRPFTLDELDRKIKIALQGVRK